MTQRASGSMLDAFEPTLPASRFVEALPPRCMVSLAALQGAALDAALGLALPATPRRVTQDGITYLWSGPNAWLAMSANDVSETLRKAAGPAAALTEQSDGISLLRVSGTPARAVLAKLVGIDLDPGVFGPESVALTMAAHIGVRIWRENDGYILACFRSFVAALHHALIEASAEFEHTS